MANKNHKYMDNIHIHYLIMIYEKWHAIWQGFKRLFLGDVLI